MSAPRAKKSYGQHFLNQPAIAQRIAQSFHQVPERVLEVGPGKGMLTRNLMDLPCELLLVEADQDMVDYLDHHFPELAGQILKGNFLRTNLQEAFQGKEFGLIGNFPYNISSQILFKMLDNRLLIPEMVGMFQREMADRIVSEPGSKAYGVISVLTQAFYKGKLLFGVDRKNFSPPPKVQSAVIRLERLDKPKVPDPLFKTFRTTVKSAFNQRRKMLRNTLKPLVQDKKVLSADLFSKRPEQISISQFVEIAELIHQYR